MPTATATVSSEELSSSVLSLNSKLSRAAESSTAASLRSLYSRAAKAFLHRDFSLTSSLLTSAFALIDPPAYSPDDEIATFRRKWDILRITVETTVYCSPSPSDHLDAIPAAFRANQLLSPQSLVATLHLRSLQLFTPSNPPQKPLSVFLPHQVLTTLILSSIKLDCYDVGRGMIEDWLARRPQELTKDGHDGYSKVIELYCLHILPKLEEWQYAQDFLTYESELKESVREGMKTALRSMLQEALETRSTQASDASLPVIESLSPASTRAASPARSTSSESTNSTHTATPQTPHPAPGKGKYKTKGSLNGLTHLTPSSALSNEPSSKLLTSATTSRTVTPNIVGRSRSTSRRDISTRRRANSSERSSPVALRATAVTPLPRSSSSGSSSSVVRVPSILTLVRSYIDRNLRNATKSKMIAYFFVFVVFPTISLAVRIHRRNLRLAHAGQEAAGAAEVVRRRLRGVSTGPLVGGGLLGSMWNDVTRAVGDTIRMGGGGLA
ncbi:hypothetical protein BC835DRAFT_1414290 [Cytidiella melzeri]|nr:hypothetical protein BC835DRAFT_1414290 [Cytidiella melzeri]